MLFRAFRAIDAEIGETIPMPRHLLSTIFILSFTPASAATLIAAPDPSPSIVRAVAADASRCPKWCPNDYAPCDPPAFKNADRRCSVNY